MAKLDVVQVITRELGLRRSQVENTVKLLDDENTVPFIARYRKEMTGELDEEAIRNIEERLAYLRNLEARKEEVVRLIGEQGKLTPELQEAIEAAVKLQEVEDLYRPYRQKRRTRATIAREKGLDPLAQLIMAQEMESGSVEEQAAAYINAELGVESAEQALAGARDIIAEAISDDAKIRQAVRDFTFKEGVMTSRTEDPAKVSEYQMYYEFSEPVAKIPPHRVLALNRGESDEILKVSIEVPMEAVLSLVRNTVITNPRSIFKAALEETCEDAYRRLIAPSIEREVRAGLTETAEKHAIGVFSINLRNLILQAPVRGKVVLGIDPGFRTGSKVAVVNRLGDLLATATIYPHPPQKEYDQAKAVLLDLIKRHEVEIITIGNGTASRETELLVADLIRESPREVAYIIVSEAGASVYSASKLAREEFPDLDVSIRGAVSIARRLQDPMAELVKIDPKSIGVGLYQHDVNQTQLDESLGDVVESCVNYVGVELNSASPALLQYVSGISSAVAKNIIKHRQGNGAFRSRRQLMKVSRLGEQTFTQCAGFLRISEGDNPLDNTPVHPESYEVAEKILALVGYDLESLRDRDPEQTALRRKALQGLKMEETAAKVGAGVPTVRDIIEALQKPGRDPRDQLNKPLLRTDVLTMEDLQVGMELDGTVRNVVDFGVFVDIGVKEDGLVHISELSDRFVKEPTEVAAVGDIVKVRVKSIDLERGRIGLTMRLEKPEGAKAREGVAAGTSASRAEGTHGASRNSARNSARNSVAQKPAKPARSASKQPEPSLEERLVKLREHFNQAGSAGSASKPIKK